jgi:hypothetical protein
MTSTRNLHLDPSVGRDGPLQKMHDQQQTGAQSGTRHPGTDEANRQSDIQKFETLLNQSRQAAVEQPAPVTQTVRDVFALLGQQQQTYAAGLNAPADLKDHTPTPLERQLQESLSRLMVDDDHRGNRQVRMELKDDLLPGVTVIVEQSQGRLQVTYVCGVEASRLKLCDQGRDQAQILATRLEREILVAVRTNDDQDPCLVEFLGAP